MVKKNALFYIASILAILIPVPCGLFYGLILAFTFNVLYFSFVPLNFLLDKYIEVPFKWAFAPLYFVFIISIEKILISLWSASFGMQIELILYVQAFSFYIIYVLNNVSGYTLKSKIQSQIPQCILYSVVAILFSLLRDILGHMAITFAGFSGLHYIHLFSINTVPLMNFFASIPGATVISACVLFVFFLVEKKQELGDE